MKVKVGNFYLLKFDFTSLKFSVKLFVTDFQRIYYTFVKWSGVLCFKSWNSYKSSSGGFEKLETLF